MNIILQKQKNNFYKVRQTDDESMKTLIDFLTEIGSDVEGWKNFIIDNRWQFKGTDSTILSKKDNTVLIEYRWAPEDCDGKYDISLSNVQFFYLLNKWVTIFTLKPQQIIITLESGELFMEGE
jgi:hypothetical protein